MDSKHYLGWDLNLDQHYNIFTLDPQDFCENILLTQFH